MNVTATVADESGRFVPSLTKDDFEIFENGRRQEISHFSNERTPVSLGILLDVSGSMTPDKMAAARSAIDRFIYDLLDRDDELFFMEFASSARVTQVGPRPRGDQHAVGGWIRWAAPPFTTPSPGAADGRGRPAQEEGAARHLGRQRHEQHHSVPPCGSGFATAKCWSTRSASTAPCGRSRRAASTIGLPIPNPFPRPRGPIQFPPITSGGGSGGTWKRTTGERVNPEALREVTDDTGGRTEIVRGFGDLQAATARLADELSKQYSLAYSSTEDRDGRWHAIRVEVRDRRFTCGRVAGTPPRPDRVFPRSKVQGPRPGIGLRVMSSVLGRRSSAAGAGSSSRPASC